MKNADYWRGRFAVLEEAAHNQADEYLHTLEDIYREAEHTVQRDIESWYQRFATNNKVTLAEARKMLTTGQLEEFKWTVEQYVKAAQRADLSPEWIKKLENASTRFHVSRLETIQLQIQQQIELLYGNQVDGIDDLLKGVVSNGYTRGAFEVQKGIGLGWDFTALNQKKLETLLSKPWTTDGRTFRDRCWANKADLVDTVNKELIQGMLRGDPPAKIITAIQKQFGTSRYKARRLVHTETSYFNAVSKIQMYKDLGVDQIEIVETLDARTCAVCQPLDGTVVPLSQYEPGVTVPPFHPNCRGTTCPHYDDMEGERVARNAEGEVYYIPDNMTYANWKKVFVDGGSKDGLTVVTVGSIIKYDIEGNTTKLKAAMREEDYKEYLARLENHKNENIKRIYSEYADKIDAIRFVPNGGVYKPASNSLEFGYDDVLRYPEIDKYSTLAHEYGHFFDVNVNIERLSFAEVEKINAAAGKKVIKKGISTCDEFVSAVREDKKYIKSIWTKEIKAELRAHDASSGVQDAISGMFEGSFGKMVRWGHDDSYYNRFYNNRIKVLGLHKELQKIYKELGMDASNQAKVKAIARNYETASEIWANVISAEVNSGKELEYVKKYLPNSYAAMQKILKEI